MLNRMMNFLDHCPILAIVAVPILLISLLAFSLLISEIETLGYQTILDRIEKEPQLQKSVDGAMLDNKITLWEYMDITSDFYKLQTDSVKEKLLPIGKESKKKLILVEKP